MFFISYIEACNSIKVKLYQNKIHFELCVISSINNVQNMVSKMCELDQEIREMYCNDRNNHDIKVLMIEIDEYHTKKMKEIIEDYGWLKISQFGEQTDFDAWLLIQHSDDLEFQKYCLVLMQDALKTGDTNIINVAYLHDRIALQLSEFNYQQRYGTQFFYMNNAQLVLQPYEGTINDVNKRRQEIGLPPIKDEDLP